MFKSLSVVVLSLFPILSQAACPNLAGEYWCVDRNSRGEEVLDLYVVEQSVEPEFPLITHFKTRYASIPNGGDTFSADEYGIEDGWGWISKCTGNKVVSVRNDFSALSEIYLSSTGRYTRTYNYNVVQSCVRKASASFK